MAARRLFECIAGWRRLDWSHQTAGNGEMARTWRSRIAAIVLFTEVLGLGVEASAEERLAQSIDASAYVPRTALIIGNSDYESSPLGNPKNDAMDMAAALRGLGFKVLLETDANQETMLAAIRHFEDTLRTRRGVGLFYYAGHGVQIDGTNYLVPIGTNIQRDYEARSRAVPADLVVGAMQFAGNPTNIVLLDACRNNPFARSFRSASSGLARMSARGIFIGYAAEPGQVALDGGGRNGVFTKHLLEHIQRKGLELSGVFKRVIGGVQDETRGLQSPWQEGSFKGDFYFVPSLPSAAPENAELADRLEAESMLWESVRESNRFQDLVAYLETYPDGVYAPLARKGLQAQDLPTKSSADAERTPPGMAHLTVRSNVLGDQVYLDGIAKGPTRLDLELPPGEYSLRVEKPGYVPYESKVTLVASSDPSIVRASLVPMEGFGARSFRDVLRDGSRGPVMVWLPAGSFSMGSPSSERRRNSDERSIEVSVSRVAIGKYEVTFEEYGMFSRATARHRAHNAPWGKGRLPAVNLNWLDAMAYAEWLSENTGKRYRLPTEAEWEYAARAGSAAAYPWGDAVGKNRANCGGCGSNWDGKQATIVGTFEPNEWGIYDTSGNVWEWTCSEYQAGYTGAERACISVDSNAKRVLRGGSWRSRPEKIRSGERDRGWAADRSNEVGFRLARER